MALVVRLLYNTEDAAPHRVRTVLCGSRFVFGVSEAEPQPPPSSSCWERATKARTCTRSTGIIAATPQRIHLDAVAMAEDGTAGPKREVNAFECSVCVRVCSCILRLTCPWWWWWCGCVASAEAIYGTHLTVHSSVYASVRVCV